MTPERCTVEPVLVIDFETTGMPLWGQPSGDPLQPHIVEVAAQLWHGDEPLDSYTAIVKPEGWFISPEVSAIHGITQEQALREGLPEREVAAQLWPMIMRSKLAIAHNVVFDARIYRIALKRYSRQETAERWQAHPKWCTMRRSLEIMGPGKWPKLHEALSYFCAETLEGAHRARADLEACYKVYREQVRRGLTLR